MPAYPLRALVLRKTKLGEADFILTMMASDGRQVRAVAKGARNPRSRIGGRVEPLSVLDLLLHSGRNLETISEAQMVASHDRIRRNLDRVSAAGAVADLLDKISVEGQGEPQLFEMSCVTLDVMEVAPPESMRLLLAAFLLKALAMHGYRPTLEGCASCGREPEGDVVFSPRSGGVLCAGCAPQDPTARHLSADSLAVMRALLRSRMADVPALGVPDDLCEDVLRLVVAYVGWHVPAKLKALELYMRGM